MQGLLRLAAGKRGNSPGLRTAKTGSNPCCRCRRLLPPDGRGWERHAGEHLASIAMDGWRPSSCGTGAWYRWSVGYSRRRAPLLSEMSAR